MFWALQITTVHVSEYHDLSNTCHVRKRREEKRCVDELTTTTTEERRGEDGFYYICCECVSVPGAQAWLSLPKPLKKTTLHEKTRRRRGVIKEKKARWAVLLPPPPPRRKQPRRHLRRHLRCRLHRCPPSLRTPSAPSPRGDSTTPLFFERWRPFTIYTWERRISDRCCIRWFDSPNRLAYSRSVRGTRPSSYCRPWRTTRRNSRRIENSEPRDSVVAGRRPGRWTLSSSAEK